MRMAVVQRSDARGLTSLSIMVMDAVEGVPTTALSVAAATSVTWKSSGCSTTVSSTMEMVRFCAGAALERVWRRAFAVGGAAAQRRWHGRPCWGAARVAGWLSLSGCKAPTCARCKRSAPHSLLLWPHAATHAHLARLPGGKCQRAAGRGVVCRGRGCAAASGEVDAHGRGERERQVDCQRDVAVALADAQGGGVGVEARGGRRRGRDPAVVREDGDCGDPRIGHGQELAVRKPQRDDDCLVALRDCVVEYFDGDVLRRQAVRACAMQGFQ